MQLAMRIGHAIALAQRVEVVAPPGVALLGHHERIGDRARVTAKGRDADAREFRVQKRHVKRCVVDDDLGAGHIIDEFRGDVLECGLVGQELTRQAVHFEGRLVAVAAGVDVAVKIVAAQASIDEFNTADLDYPMSPGRIKAGRFGVEDYLSHEWGAVVASALKIA